MNGITFRDKSLVLKKIAEFKKNTFFDLYNQLTSEQQRFFRMMYSHKNPELSIEEIYDKIPLEKIDWAIYQCENTIIKNNKQQ